MEATHRFGLLSGTNRQDRRFRSHLLLLLQMTNSVSSHPMHLHGHNTYILAEGIGEWDGTVTRPQNPHRRDVYLIRAGGHLVMQFDVNPGVWAFHCHIAWHASGGFFSTLVVDSRKVQRMRIPGDIQDNCRAWDLWSKRNVVDQIDSGA